jgi:hypothetical protein
VLFQANTLPEQKELCQANLVDLILQASPGACEGRGFPFD